MAQSKFAVCCTKKGREPAGVSFDVGLMHVIILVYCRRYTEGYHLLHGLSMVKTQEPAALYNLVQPAYNLQLYNKQFTVNFSVIARIPP